MQSVWPDYHRGLFRIQSAADGPATGLFPVPLSFSRSEGDSDQWHTSGGGHPSLVSGYNDGEASGHHDDETWNSQPSYPREQPPPQYQLPLPTIMTSEAQHYASQHQLPYSDRDAPASGGYVVGTGSQGHFLPRLDDRHHYQDSERYTHSHHIPPFAHDPAPSIPTIRHMDHTQAVASHHTPQSQQSVEVWLRSQSWLSGLHPSTPITLDALHSPRDPYDKPPYTMHQLAAVAIFSHPRQKASSSEIRDMLKERYPYYTDKKELSETLKHALSSYFLFRRTSRVSTQPGRGGLWELDVLTNPNGRRNRKRGSRQNSASLEEDAYDDFGNNNNTGGLHPGMPYPPSELAGPSLPPYPPSSSTENRLYTFSQPSYSVDSPGSEGSTGSASDTSPAAGQVPSPEFLAAQNHYLMESQAFALSLRGLETLPRSRSVSPYRTPSSEEASYHRRSSSTQRRGLPSRAATPSTSSSPSGS